jgi:two-component SAPR family response regulator
LNDLADGRYKQGSFDEALRLYSEALKQAHQAANALMEAAVLYGQADIYNDLGGAMQAAQLYGDALSIAAKIENHRLLQYGCLRTCSLYRRRGNITVANEWLKRALAIEGEGARSARTSIELAVLESRASPRNAAANLRALLDAPTNTLSLEEKALGGLFLGYCQYKSGAIGDAKVSIVSSLEAASIGGGEQGLAAELAADPEMIVVVTAVAAGDPVLEIVLGRVEAISAHRRQADASSPSVADVHSLVVSSFGAGRIAVGSQLVRELKPQARELLYYLVDNKAVGKEVLAETFWPQHPPGRRSANIHSAIHSIRKVLGRQGVLLEDGVYLVNPDLLVQYDVEQFERAADVAQRLSVGDPRRMFAVNEAVNSYRGPFLSEFESRWAVDRRRSLEQRYLDLVAELATEALIRDQPRRALDHLRKALAIDPFRDDLHIHYLEALGRLGSLAEISSHYSQYAKLLRDELSAEPSDDLRKLYHRLIG